MANLKKILINNVVTLLFCIVCLIGIILADQPLAYIVGEISSRLFRNLIIILALLIPVWAGMGMNFSIVVGAMAAQIGIIISINFSISGVLGLVVAFLVSVPLSLGFGNLVGRLFNKTKGQEMITGMILGFFAKGLYDLVLTNGIGLITPITLDDATNGAINDIWKVPLDKGLMAVLLIAVVVKLLSILWRKYKKGEDVEWKKQYGLFALVVLFAAYMILVSASETVRFALAFTQMPVGTGILIVIVCIYTTFLSKTKLGSDINAVGQNMNIAVSMGIPADKIRIIAIMISTLLAGLGQLVFIQDIGNFTTYTAHENVGTFAIAALLVGGASIQKASISHAVIGALLFHTMFVVSPLAGRNLFDNAQLGEYFRVFACYAVIAVALALHAWKTVMAKQAEGKEETGTEAAQH